MDSGRRILAGNRRGDDAGELPRGADRLLLADGGNPPRDPSAVAFLAVFVDEIGEALGAEAVDQPPGRLPLGGVEAEIEGAVGIEGEAPFDVGELVAREPDVEEHRVDLVNRECVEHLRQIAVVGLCEPDRQPGEQVDAAGDGAGVTIDGDHQAGGADRLGEEPGVSAPPERAVDDPVAGLEVEERERLGRKDARVDRGRHGGGAGLGGRAGKIPRLYHGSRPGHSACRCFRHTMLRMPDADAYDYDLPRELIAQEPLADRSAARMLVVRRSDGALAHRHVHDLVDLLHPGDLLVVNDTRVVPARLEGRREMTGGRWEGLWLESLADGDWRLLAHTRGRMAIGERVVLVDAEGADRFTLEMTGRGPGGTWLARPDRSGTAEQLLGEVGRVPLPGYIRGGDARADDLPRYQTVFARHAGSAAAPTAGLHFTPSLLAALADRGIGMARVTLHVGIDTFRPIAVDNLDDHPMHTEWCECPPETVAAVAAARGRGGRVIAVGTTAVRTLETAAGAGVLAPWSGPTSLFIRPGHTFRAVDCLLTNFHMPRTTLMVLVSTFAGRELVERAYAEAIAERYRFLSYGDCVLFG